MQYAKKPFAIYATFAALLIIQVRIAKSLDMKLQQKLHPPLFPVL